MSILYMVGVPGGVGMLHRARTPGAEDILVSR